MEGMDQIVDQLQEVQQELMGVVNLRKTVPEQYASTLLENLRLKQLSAEKTIFLPRKNLKKPSFKQQLNAVDNLCNSNEGETIKAISDLIPEVRKDQLNLLKVLEMVLNEVESVNKNTENMETDESNALE